MGDIAESLNRWILWNFLLLLQPSVPKRPKLKSEQIPEQYSNKISSVTNVQQEKSCKRQQNCSSTAAGPAVEDDIPQKNTHTQLPFSDRRRGHDHRTQWQCKQSSANSAKLLKRVPSPPPPMLLNPQKEHRIYVEVWSINNGQTLLLLLSTSICLCAAICLKYCCNCNCV